MLVLGICGGTGSGKTTIVNALLNEFPKNDMGSLSQDSYYKDTNHLTPNERKNINFDHPESIDFDLLVSHLKTLKNNNAIKQPVYSFVEHNRTHKTVLTHPKKVMLVEGILILSHPELRDLLDIKIFVDADEDERLMRRIKRDTKERGRTADEVLNRYQNTLKPMHNQFIEPMKAHADMIVPNNNQHTIAVDIIKTLINSNV